MPEDACEAYVQSTVRHLRLLCKSNARQSAASHEHTAMSIIYGKKTCTSSRARCGVVREIQDSCVGVFHRDSPALHVRNAKCHIFIFILGSALLEERKISQSHPDETNRMGKQIRMLVFGPLEMATTPKACIPRGARHKVQRTLSTIGSDKICPILYRPESKVSGEPIWTPSRRSFVQIASGAALRLTTTLRCASIARSRRFYFGRSTRDPIFLVFASLPSFVPFATLGTDESVWYVGLKALLDRGNPA